MMKKSLVVSLVLFIVSLQIPVWAQDTYADLAQQSFSCLKELSEVLNLIRSERDLPPAVERVKQIRQQVFALEGVFVNLPQMSPADKAAFLNRLGEFRDIVMQVKETAVRLQQSGLVSPELLSALIEFTALPNEFLDAARSRGIPLDFLRPFTEESEQSVAILRFLTETKILPELLKHNGFLHSARESATEGHGQYKEIVTHLIRSQKEHSEGSRELIEMFMGLLRFPEIEAQLKRAREVLTSEPH